LVVIEAELHVAFRENLPFGQKIWNQSQRLGFCWYQAIVIMAYYHGIPSIADAKDLLVAKTARWRLDW